MEDIPADLFFVLDHALTIVSWRENLPEDEIPPHWMWHLDWELEAWFQKVKIERERKYGTNNKDGVHDNFNDLGPDGEPLFERNEFYDEMLAS